MDPDQIPADEQQQLGSLIKVAAIAGVGGLLLLGFIVIQYSFAKKRDGTVVLPAGTTYLGPSNSPAAETPAAPQPTPQKVTFENPTQTVTVKGKRYPYSFQAPKSMELVTFPDDPYDIYAIKWGNILPQSNVLIGVDNLRNDDKKTQYINGSKRTYVSEWWKQFAGLKGVGSLEEFTNSKGMKGYRVKYINSAGQTPNDDVFFEVAGKPEYVIHLASGIIDMDVFNAIVDSVSWAGAATQPATATPTP